MSYKLEDNVEEVASKLGFPEGPVAMDDGSILFVDIEYQTLMQLHPDGTLEEIATLPGGPNGLAIGPDGAAYVCNNGGVYGFAKMDPSAPPGSGRKANPARVVNVPIPMNPKYQGGEIQRVDLKTKEVTTLYCKYKGKCLIAPDDIVFDKKNGGFWFTDTGTVHAEGSDFGAVYYATIDGQTLEKVASIPTPNGIGISPDGDTLYVSDTSFGRLWAMNIVGAGKVEPGPLVGMPGKVIQTLDGYQWLDSLKVEADGRVCVGTLITGGISIFSLDGAVEHLELPDPFTTNLCFGGEDMRDVWITASGTQKIYKTRWPRPGLKLAYTA
ncbi:Gluconolactonase precursor [Shimia sp. SK013]|uniref:SMP-30/gluconolactonase/LRE family protein n=1 Tax=Shimia sp. SK013 TaxID=1389006 RepID=UPI0006B654E0|nr:SMP-30/gluconolactonase/LRE family protein [Shimia sp. SK013]KPA21812.1 Gluconolactonase precursor [Shimia sp. SK013]